jgi:hypothetical protein
MDLLFTNPVAIIPSLEQGTQETLINQLDLETPQTRTQFFNDMSWSYHEYPNAAPVTDYDAVRRALLAYGDQDDAQRLSAIEASAPETPA